MYCKCQVFCNIFLSYPLAGRTGVIFIRMQLKSVRIDADFSRGTAVSGRDRQSWMLRGTVGWIQLRLSGGLLMRLQGMSLINRAANDL